MKTLEYQRTTALSVGVQAVFVVLCGLALSWLAVKLPMPLILAALVGMGYCILFLQRPDLGLLTVLAVRSSTDVTIWLMGLATRVNQVHILTPNAGLIIILVGCGSLYMLARRVPFLSLPGGVLLILLVVAGLVGMLRSESIVTSLIEWLATLSTVVVYALAAYLFRTPQKIQRVIDVLAVSFITPAIFGLWQFAHNAHSGTRISGTFVDAPAFSQYLVLILGVFTGQFLVHSGRRKVLATVIVVTSGILLIATYTRGAWLCAVVTLLVIALLRKRTLLVCALIIAMVLGARMIPAIGARVADPFGGSFADRVFLWQSTFDEWTRTTADSYSSVATIVNRLGGLGPGAQPLLTSRGGYGTQIAHDDYLRVFVDYGIFGLAVYLLLTLVVAVFAYRTFRRCTDNRLRAVAMSFVALTIGYAVFSLTDNIFGKTNVQFPMWMLAGMIVAIARLQLPGDARQPAA